MALFDKVLGLNAYLHQPVRKLSLGERMRCDLAASLIHRRLPWVAEALNGGDDRSP